MSEISAKIFAFSLPFPKKKDFANKGGIIGGVILRSLKIEELHSIN